MAESRLKMGSEMLLLCVGVQPKIDFAAKTKSAIGLSTVSMSAVGSVEELAC